MKMTNVGDMDLEELLEGFDRHFKKWALIDFGKHEGLTIPQLVFRDPAYFYWGLSLKCFKGWPLALQAEVVESRLRHIKLPTAMRGNSAFVIKLNNGRFADFVIIDKSRVAGRNRANEKVESYLDFSIVSRPDVKTKDARTKMVERIKYYFFEQDADALRKEDFEAFIGNADQFGSASRTKYLPKIPRWDDAGVLEETKKADSNEFQLSPEAIQRMADAAFRKTLLRLERDRDNDQDDWY